MALNGISTIDRTVVEAEKSTVETKVKTVVKTNKVDPCKKCNKKFDSKSNICNSCVEFKGAMKWHEAK